MTRDGQWPAQEFIAAVLQHAPREANANLMATNFANARHAAAHFLPEDQRDVARAEIAQASWNLLISADPG